MCLELIKVVIDLPLERFRDAFMNLALPEMPLMLTEPAAAKMNTVMKEGLSYYLIFS